MTTKATKQNSSAQSTAPKSNSNTKTNTKKIARDAQGRFVKGHEWAGGGNTLGEKKRLSQEASLRIHQIFYDRLDTLPATLDKLEISDPAQYAKVLMSMAKFTMPSLQAQQLDISVDDTVSIESILSQRMSSPATSD